MVQIAAKTMKRNVLRLAAAAASLLLACSTAQSTPKGGYAWIQLADGLSYATFSFSRGADEPSTAIHAFRVDPKKFRVGVVTAKDEKAGATASEMARRAGAIIAVNGGFFTPQHTSIGLIVKNGKELSPLHKTSWWSVFAIGKDGPAIYSLRNYRDAKGVNTALQAGPRLVIDGKIPRLKESVASRSAVGITRDGKVVIAVTQGPGISMTELARRMGSSQFRGGFDCRNAMALDGGSSSQLYAKIKKFELSLPNIARVTNGLAVFSK